MLRMAVHQICSLQPRPQSSPHLFRPTFIIVPQYLIPNAKLAIDAQITL